MFSSFSFFDCIFDKYNLSLDPDLVFVYSGCFEVPRLDGEAGLAGSPRRDIPARSSSTTPKQEHYQTILSKVLTRIIIVIESIISMAITGYINMWANSILKKYSSILRA